MCTILCELRAQRVSCAWRFLAVIAVGVTAGCASLVNGSTDGIGGATLSLYQVDPVLKRQNDTTAGKDGIALPIDLDNYTLQVCTGSAGSPQCSSPKAYDAATSDASGITRNRLEAALIRHSDVICSQTEAEIVGTNDLINFGLGETTTILAGAGALVSGVTTARILSGLAAMSNATRSQVDEVFYQNELKAAIVQAINKQRAGLLETMVDRSFDPKTRNATPLSQYSTEEMLNDVETYHDACSFYAGVNGLTQPAQKINAAGGAPPAGAAAPPAGAAAPPAGAAAPPAGAAAPPAGAARAVGSTVPLESPSKHGQKTSD